jgi:TetR/AcrR family transcriptional repressor of nem operon
MRLTKAQRAENHERIVRVAARLFCEKGIDGVGIDEIMGAAGLTHGAFYGHFPSKAALVAEAAAQALDQSGLKRLDAEAGPDGQRGFVEFARRYLSARHRDNPGQGCAIAAIGADIGRQDADGQSRFAAGLDTAFDQLARRLPGPPGQARRDAMVKYATLVGALVMARSAGQSALSAELLGTVLEELEAEAAG